jgi:hypothetical protein
MIIHLSGGRTTTLVDREAFYWCHAITRLAQRLGGRNQAASEGTNDPGRYHRDAPGLRQLFANHLPTLATDSEDVTLVREGGRHAHKATRKHLRALIFPVRKIVA